MTSFATSLRVAGTHQEPVGPGLEPIRITERGQVPPCIKQRLLGCVLGEIRIAKNPSRHGVHGVDDETDERVEGLLIAVHRP